LSAAQFGRSLQDLLGTTGALPAVEESLASASLKSIGASVTAVSPRGVELFETATNAALDVVFADPARTSALIGCTPAPTAWDEACARTFLQTFGRRAWRRPLAADELTRYLKLGQDEAQEAGGTFADGARAIISALLQSPNFLYRVELGDAPLAGNKFGRYAPYETATRLSFLLWSTTPDAQLLTAAESGGLATADGIRKEAQRLIASPRLADGLADMIDDLMALDNVGLMAKDPKLYPQLTPTLRQAMRDEVVKTFQDVAVGRDADLMELFDTNRTFVNAELGKLYGITVTGTDPVAAQQPAGVPRSGLLTMAAILSVQDKQAQTSPTRRGAFFRKTFVCEHIPDPPPNVDVTIKEPPPGVAVSRRDLLAGHATDNACAGCHRLMDPIGLAFENFDALGLYRTKEENGLAIDPSGTFDGTAFTGPRELGALLRQSQKARDCMARRIYRFATGREETAYDEAQIQKLGQAFATAGQRLRPYLVELVASDGFVNVSPVKK
jgi:hypothetical protein